MQVERVRWMLGVALLSLPVAVHGYPNKPVRLLVGQEAGSALDNSVRAITPMLSEALGQQVVIDNRPGVGGMIALQIALAAVADGHTLVNAGSPQMIAPFLFRKLPYDLFRDFVPIARLSVNQSVLVTAPGFAPASVKDLIALLKAKPGAYNMASAGAGSASHLAGALFSTMTQTSAVHVPYKGGAAAVIALISNESQFLITPLSATLAQIKAGRIRVLAVAGDVRAPQLPDIPTMEEAGLKGYRNTGWNGLFGPKGMPVAAVTKLIGTLRGLMATPALQERLLGAGVQQGFLAGADFERFMREDMARFGVAVKAAGLTPE